MRFFRIVYVVSIVGDSCCVPGCAREPELEPKHKIFLNHSGVQKTFTEQLCKSLEGCHYYPIFGKRPDSLPKGKKIPDLILQAARQCQVAESILSKDFFSPIPSSPC